MRAGRLRHRVWIENPTEVDSGDGLGLVRTWNKVQEIYAAVEPIGSRERLQNNQIEAGITHRVTSRYTASLTTKSRLLFRGRYLHVVGPPINTDERDREVVVNCEERLGDS